MLPVAALITIALMGIVTIGLIVWDIVVATNKIPNSVDTISGRMKIWGKKTLILPWAWAVLFGHFWGPIKASSGIFSHKVGIALLVLLTWGVFVAGTVLHKHGIAINSSWLVFLSVLNLGAIAGAILWAQ